MATTTTSEIQALAKTILILGNGLVLDTPDDSESLRALAKLNVVMRAYTCLPTWIKEPNYYVVPGYEKFFKRL